MNGRRWPMMLLAGSLGLNVALGGVLIHRETLQEQERQLERTDWQARRSSSQSPLQRGRRDTLGLYHSQGEFLLSDLSRDQVHQLRGMRHKAEEEIEDYRRTIGQIQSQIRSELEQEKPNTDYIDSLTVTSSRMQRNIQQRLVRLMIEERSILTPEQYQGLLRRMAPGMFGGFEYGRGGGPAQGGGRELRRPPGGGAGGGDPPPQP